MAGKGCCQLLAVGLLASVGLAAVSAQGAVAAATPGENDLVGSVAAAADAEQQLHQAGAQVQTLQEQVNQAIVRLGAARDTAAVAESDVRRRQDAVLRARSQIEEAQHRFDLFAVSTYVNGPSASSLMATDPAEALSTLAAGRAIALSQRQSLANLNRARTREVDAESSARATRDDANAARAAAQRLQEEAVSDLTAARAAFADQRQRIESLAADRRIAKDAAGVAADSTKAWDLAADRGPGAASVQEWDTTLPSVPSANVTTDPLAVVNSILGVASASANVTADLGRSFLNGLGIVPAEVPNAQAGLTNGAIPRAYGRQASEYVIRRAMSQIGVPYSWGGGSAAGPSRGIDSGAGTSGFDCSGIVLFAFAGVGIKLPHYSGDQYDAGRKVPSAQMRRGDVIFYGPGASQHEALYLGQGMMLEAPFTGSDVHVSAVRTSGMTPYVTRFIEY
ncbi:C40 family peptidase [Mycolicibacterium arabiense]|nr:C40 family peptidase [Mycolicibacterium arabiense]